MKAENMDKLVDILDNYLQSNDEKSRKKIKYTLEALNDETNELLKIMGNVFDDIKKVEEGEKYCRLLKETQNYFSTYENNAYIVGEISDPTYRNCIIRHYLLSKRFVDALLANSLFFEKYLENQSKYSDTNKPDFKNMIDIFEKCLQHEAKHLKGLVKEIEQNLSCYNDSHAKFIKNFKP